MNCELSNIDAVDENITNAVGLETESEYSNFAWGSVISAVGGIAGGLIAGQQKKKSDERAAQAQREADQRAAEREAAQQRFETEKQKLLLEKARLETEALAKMQEQQQKQQLQLQQQQQQRLDGSGATGTGSGKFLGMPKAVGITVTVVGGLALIVGGILIVRKIRKK